VSERLEELLPFPNRSEALAPLVGQSSGEPQLSPHAVNAPMIRHWVEAMGDENPVYVSEESGLEYGHGGVIAPASMLQAWIMRGLKVSQMVEAAREAGEDQGSGPNDAMMRLLDEEGLTSVVATNCEQHYGRQLVIGDRLLVTSVIESITDPKRTGLGTGRFLTTPRARPPSRSPAWPPPASRWPPCAFAFSNTCRRCARLHRPNGPCGRARPRPRTTPSGSPVPRNTSC
jgi:hypothetical protein